MDSFKVNIDTENNVISVYNNGRGIPIEIHSKEKIWIPELIFGNLCVSMECPDLTVVWYWPRSLTLLSTESFQVDLFQLRRRPEEDDRRKERLRSQARQHLFDRIQ